MTDRNIEKMAEKEKSALAKLQAAAGIVPRPMAERLDWMYEQSSSSMKPDDDTLMNMPVEGSKDQDVEDVKKLGDNTAGSLFLRSATKTTEDMLRKLREDPLFQIRRQEQAAKANMMANPLIQARLKQKAEKEAKKLAKKEKKAIKKEKKKEKKAAKKEKKSKKAKDSSSSSDSSEPAAATPVPAAPHPGRDRERSPRRRAPSPDLSRLGPSGVVVDKRAEYEAQVKARRDAALASRGASQRMTEEEKQRRFDQMKADAATHERHKDARIVAAEKREKEIEEMESKLRANSDQSYFKEMRKQTYMDSDLSVADRLKNQRHRRGKNLNDPLERDDK